MTVTDFILNQPPRMAELLESVRAHLLAAHPAMEEKIRYGIPFFDYKGMLFYLNPVKDHIVIGIINGHLLADEEGLLQAGDRKMIRHLPVHRPEDMEKEEVRAMIQQALLVREGEKKYALKKRRSES